MFKTVSKIVVITVMLIAFVGQAIAFNTAMPCETSKDTLSFNHTELVKTYDIHTNDKDSQEDCCGIDCCDIDCTCISNMCSSTAYFSNEINSTPITSLGALFYRQATEQTKFIATLLYRPPIFIS